MNCTRNTQSCLSCLKLISKAPLVTSRVHIVSFNISCDTISVGLDDICNGADGTITNKHEKDFHDHHWILCFTQLFESKSKRMTLV